MQKLKQKTLALFFTCGISLETWEKVGNLEREIRPYRELAKSFKEIYFFTYGDEKDLEFKKVLPDNIKIFPKRYQMPSILYSWLLPLIYRKQLKKADILKTNQMSGSWAAVIAGRLYKKKLIVRCGYEWLQFAQKQNKSSLKKWLISLVEKISYSTADKVIITAKSDKEFIEKRFNILPAKVEVIPNYIDTKLFAPLAIEKQKNRIVFIGRLGEQKNLFNLIEAVGNMPVKLAIIGKGPLEEELKRFSKDKGSEVEFLGSLPQNQLPTELNKSQIFILPSLYEGCPKVLLEAMSCGLPCIGADVDGINEVIQHKENGYLCGTDVEGIKKGIQEVLGDGGLRERLASSARETILEKFSLQNILNKEINIYQSI